MVRYTSVSLPHTITINNFSSLIFLFKTVNVTLNQFLLFIIFVSSNLPLYPMSSHLTCFKFSINMFSSAFYNLSIKTQNCVCLHSLHFSPSFFHFPVLYLLQSSHHFLLTFSSILFVFSLLLHVTYRLSSTHSTLSPVSTPPPCFNLLLFPSALFLRHIFLFCLSSFSF